MYGSICTFLLVCAARAKYEVQAQAVVHVCFLSSAGVEIDDEPPGDIDPIRLGLNRHDLDLGVGRGRVGVDGDSLLGCACEWGCACECCPALRAEISTRS